MHTLCPTLFLQDRLGILSIHTRLWQPQLKSVFLSELADNTVGYCGADLKALCTEAALQALRRKYPQIYNTTQKLVLDVTSINVQASDFYKALKTIVPTAQRSDGACGRALTEIIRPLLLEPLSSALCRIEFIFPPAWKSVSKATKEVQGLLKVEAIRSQNLKSNVTLPNANSSEKVRWLNKSARKSTSPSVQNCDVMLQRLNHKTVSNCVDANADTDELAYESKSRNSIFRVDNLDDVYFDLNEVVDDERGSILVAEQESAVGEVADTRASPVSSTRYLSISSHPHAPPPVHRPRLLISGPPGMGQSSHLAPAILHALEDFPIQTLDLPALFAVSSKTPEEACTQVSTITVVVDIAYSCYTVCIFVRVLGLDLKMRGFDC